MPARVHPGEFYALPQSPQIFKQILMIAGFDRYVQIARCFRDEALRADRQLEFTQVDLEMSFATPPMVFEIVEGALAACFKEIGVDIPRPFKRMPYAEAIAKYGSDKPDLRFGMEIQDFGPLFAQSPFGIFREAVEHGGTIRGFVIPERGEVFAPRGRRAGRAGQAGRRRRLIYTRYTAEGVQVSAKAIGEDGARAVLEASGANKEDLLVLASGAPDAASKVLGQLRLQVAKKANLIPEGKWELTWVTDFPLFDWNADEKRWDSVNHPFTAPREEDLHMLESDPGKVLAKAYDVILNGWELGGGSIRIHDRETQAKVFRLLGMSDEDAKNRFGFFLESLEYGTPPHGGLALGLDRICALLSGETSIREVIPFPKTTQAVDLMCDAPSTVDPAAVARAAHQADLTMPVYASAVFIRNTATGRSPALHLRPQARRRERPDHRLRAVAGEDRRSGPRHASSVSLITTTSRRPATTGATCRARCSRSPKPSSRWRTPSKRSSSTSASTSRSRRETTRGCTCTSVPKVPKAPGASRVPH